MIKTDTKIHYINNDLLKENNYELFNLLVEKNINFYVTDKELCLKIIELKNQHMFKLIDSKLLTDKELYVKAKQNGLETNDRDIIKNFDIEFLEQCIKDGLDINFYSYSNYALLYNNPILRKALLKNFDVYKIQKLISNGVITDIDFDINTYLKKSNYCKY